MSRTDKCPELQELMKMLTHKTSQQSRHLRTCKECADTLALLGKSFGAGDARLETPSKASLNRAKLLPLTQQSSSDRAPVRGRIQSDSWRGASPVALRDVALGHVRRLEMAAGNVELHLVAEKSRDGWRFVARVYKQKTVVRNFVLRVGRRKLVPSELGFYHWSSRGAPKRLQLQSADRLLLFDGIRW